MPLNYIKIPPNEGGGAISNCGTIHISEIVPTLSALTDQLGLPYSLNDYVVGSTGKMEYSGDIDVVIDRTMFDGNIEDFHKDLKELFGSQDVARHGALLHLKYPIAAFNSSNAVRLPRTGFVQIDFMFGDLEWEGFYHFSAGDKSAYKGAHRNLAISAITTHLAEITSIDVDSYARPISLIKWKWGSNGFIQVIRTSVKKKDVWLKQQHDELVQGPIKNPHVISRTLFPADGTPDDLNSLETLIAAVKRNFTTDDRADIFARIAANFDDWQYGHYFKYPPEIK